MVRIVELSALVVGYGLAIVAGALLAGAWLGFAVAAAGLVYVGWPDRRPEGSR